MISASLKGIRFHGITYEHPGVSRDAAGEEEMALRSILRRSMISEVLTLQQSHMFSAELG